MSSPERHSLDLTSLIFGVLFSVIAAAFLVRTWPIAAVELRLVFPAVVTGAGLVLLASTLRTRHDPQDAPAGNTQEGLGTQGQAGTASNTEEPTTERGEEPASRDDR